MPDIRQNTGFIDDFDRPNEDPLSNGGQWTTTPGFNKLVLKGNAVTHSTSFSFGDMYWNPLSMDGDAAECWGYQAGGGASGIAWAVDLWTTGGNGYRFRYEVAATNSRWRIYADGGIVDDTGPIFGGMGTYENGHGVILIRRNGGLVEGWSTPDTDLINGWTQWCSASESSYTTGLHAGLGVTDNSSSQIHGWEAFGAGVRLPFVPQIYRRPYD